jgi:DNA repair protein SbcD/Mre11
LPEGVPHTMVHEVWSEEVDILLTGHYHAGFSLQHRDGKYIVNPGALARINSHRSEIGRMPQAVLIDLDRNRGINIRFIPLSCARPGDEVLDRSYIETAVFRQEQFRSFIQTIRSNTEFRALDVRDIIDEISRLEGIEDEVKYEALRRIAIEQEAEGEKVW